MSDILDHGLREQLAEALLGWGEAHAAQPTSQDTAVNDAAAAASADDDRGRHTPRADPPPANRANTPRAAVQSMPDDTDDTTVVDDIDADSVLDPTDPDTDPDTSHAVRLPQRSRDAMARPLPVAAADKALPPLPSDAAAGSPPLEMSCRISRFPFSHPCEVPEVMPDHEDAFAAETRTFASASGPAPTLTALTAAAAEPDLDARMPRMSLKSVPSEVSVPDSLDMVRERDGDDMNSDGVSMLTPTEASLDDDDAIEGEPGAGRLGRQAGYLTADYQPPWASVSSLGSASGSSADWRPSHASAAPRSPNFFSRMGNGNGTRPSAEEEFLDEPSLTPLQQLSSPPQRPPDHPDKDTLAPNVPAPPPAPSSSISPSPRGTHRQSRFFQRMPWLGDSQQPRKPEGVFGVDLKYSIRTAPMKIRISHNGRSTSYRTFPLSVHKCCEFIRRAGGTDGNIFSAPGDARNVASLKAIFSQPPTYGEQFRFEGTEYTVHDAAGLILLYLEELPKPLIPAPVVKSWILLARREGAIEPPLPRVETGLDFWTEALNRLPTANRNLAKHLLTLFAEVLIAATGDISEADARQLAASVSRAMFHQDLEAGVPGGQGGEGGGGSGHGDRRASRDVKRTAAAPRRNVQPTLALAFLIRKRGEYAVSLSQRAAGSGSKRESKFLPSTREMLEWKGVGH